MADSTMTLWQLAANQTAKVFGLAEAMSPEVASRLRQMGFYPGQSIHCLRRSPLQGPLVVQLGDCVYSLDKQVAEGIALHP
ncbi:ferrous iron transport protein A [Aestuariibacter halophilus]|uniref:Ferrous iron transport protein A n=1 Tax=Fluctibacter halophilus TaxID=226011 RepID=A0ABS8G9M9_9ALTE|nr:FeoA family protein [Aestuariibacter halophilus]MCC2617282.1 ferrous iron transport protein A [Aestuariibacter halophilus]